MNSKQQNPQQQNPQQTGKQKVSQQEPKKPKPTVIPSLRVEANGDNGKYIISVFASDKDGKAIKNLPVSFVPEDDLSDNKTVSTNDNGAVVQSVHITSLERFVLVMADGMEAKRIHLFGPISEPTETTNNERSLILWE